MRWVLIGWLALGCADLASVERLRCGNGLHEPQADEDCDGATGDAAFACGEPGTGGACRYLCDAARCPPGFECGGDGICRAGAGRFEPPWSAPIEGRFLTLGELDGDGFPDLVAVSAARLLVAYGDSAGTFGDLRTRRIGLSELPAAVGDVDGDGLDDVAILTDQGLSVFPGREDRQLIPIATQEQVEEGAPVAAFGVRAMPPYDDEQLLEIWQADEGLEFRMGRRVAAVDDPDLGDAHVPRGGIAVGDLEGGGTADEIAVLSASGDAVIVARMTCDRAACSLATIARLAVPSGVASGTLFADVDGDGRLDLLALLTGETQQIAVSYLDADGLLGPLVVDPRLGRVAGNPTAPDARSLIVRLAVDVIGDARAEYVTGKGIWTLTDDGAGLRQVFQTSRPFVNVRAAELDGDGRPDLVARRDDALDFLVFEDEVVNQRTLALANGVTLEVGDFDGDGTDDVVIDRIAEGVLAITFAGARTEATDLQPFARLDPSPDHLVAIQPATPVPQFQLRAPAQLFALGDGVRLRFVGRGSGLPLTPLVLPRVGRDLAIGRFIDGRPAVVASAYDNIDGFGRFLLPGEALGDARPTALPDPCADPTRTPALARAVDVDGDGVDELLTLTSGVSTVSPTESGAPPAGGFEELETRAMTWTIHRARIEDGAAVCLWTGQVRSTLAPVRLEIVDFDGDGLDDIVSLMIFRRWGRDDLREPGPSAIVVWRGTGAGHAAAEVFDLPVSMVGATAVQLAGDATALVMADSARLWTAGLVDGALTLEPIGAGPKGVQALRSADVDGDGLDDLVVKTATTVFVMRQTVCSARDAWEGQCMRGPTTP